MKFRVLTNRFSAFSRGPGGFRELREAGRKHFHLSWYLSDTVVTSYGQKSWGGTFSSVYGMIRKSSKFTSVESLGTFSSTFKSSASWFGWRVWLLVTTNQNSLAKLHILPAGKFWGLTIWRKYDHLYRWWNKKITPSGFLTMTRYHGDL